MRSRPRWSAGPHGRLRCWPCCGTIAQKPIEGAAHQTAASGPRPPAPNSGCGGVAGNAVSCRISPKSSGLTGVGFGRNRTGRTGPHGPVHGGLLHPRYGESVVEPATASSTHPHARDPSPGSWSSALSATMSFGSNAANRVSTLSVGEFSEDDGPAQRREDQYRVSSMSSGPQSWWKAVLTYPPTWAAGGLLVTVGIAFLSYADPPSSMTIAAIVVAGLAAAAWPLAMSATGVLAARQFAVADPDDVDSETMAALAAELKALDDSQPFEQLVALGRNARRCARCWTVAWTRTNSPTLVTSARPARCTGARSTTSTRWLSPTTARTASTPATSSGGSPSWIATGAETDAARREARDPGPTRSATRRQLARINQLLAQNEAALTTLRPDDERAGRGSRRAAAGGRRRDAGSTRRPRRPGPYVRTGRRVVGSTQRPMLARR